MRRNIWAIPRQFWRVCDANAAMRPDELTETIGRRLRITLPEGIPGPDFLTPMLKGIHLTLMIGPAVPIPAPQSVMDALTSVQVTSGKDKSGFQLTFAVSKDSPLLRTMLPAGYFDPMITRVIIIVTLGGFPNVHHGRHRHAAGIYAEQRAGAVHADDHRGRFERADGRRGNKRPFIALSDDSAAALYVSWPSTLAFGIVPLVLPPLFLIDFLPIPTEGGRRRRAPISQLHQEAGATNGYVFYVEPGPLPGQSIAYFGPDIRIPVPQPALSVNMDAHTNVDSLSFSPGWPGQEVIDRDGDGPDHAQNSDSDSDPEHQRFQTAAGRCGRRHRPKSDSRKTWRTRSTLQALKKTVGRLLTRFVQCHHGLGFAGCDALRTRVARTHAGRRARRRPGLRRPLLRGQRHAQSQTRRI